MDKEQIIHDFAIVLLQKRGFENVSDMLKQYEIAVNDIKEEYKTIPKSKNRIVPVKGI